MAKQKVNKRNQIRLSTNIEITFKEKDQFCSSYMLNLSNGGLFIKTDEPFALDTVVTLVLTLPGESNPISVEGRVVWTNPLQSKNTFPHGMGVAFMNLHPSHKVRLDNFIESNMADIKSKSVF